MRERSTHQQVSDNGEGCHAEAERSGRPKISRQANEGDWKESETVWRNGEPSESG